MSTSKLFYSVDQIFMFFIMSQKAFCAIKFSQGTHDVVPAKWIKTKKNGKKIVYYPEQDIKDLAIQQVEPNIDWNTYGVDIIAESSE